MRGSSPHVLLRVFSVWMRQEGLPDVSGEPFWLVGPALSGTRLAGARSGLCDTTCQAVTVTKLAISADGCSFDKSALHPGQ